jgi:hypothetical protein
VAAVDEIARLGSLPADRRALAATGLVAPHPGLVAAQQGAARLVCAATRAAWLPPATSGWMIG